MTAFILSIFLFAQATPAQEEMEDRLKDLEKKVQDLEKKQAQTTSANPATVLNPTVTVVGNFFWRLDDKTVLNGNGDEIDDMANMREVELDFRSAIDPYAEGVAILSVESEVSGEFDIGVEEFLIKVKSLPLPFWEQPPLGTQIKIGRMRTEFGTNNLLHLHDLPQSNRPLVIEEFLGGEGQVSNGASAKMFLPSPGDTALQLTLQGLQGGGSEVGGDRTRPACLANLHGFFPLSDEHTLDVSLIGFYGTNDKHHQSRVWSLDFWYRWKPLRQGEYKSVMVGAQIFAGEHEFTDSVTLEDVDSKPVGFTAWAQYQLSARLYAGIRWDQTDVLADDSLQRKKVQPYLSWYMSEFFRVRASFERTWSDLPEEDGLNTFLLEINVVFGAHPTEPFWVNK